MTWIVEERILQSWKDSNNFHQKNIRVAVIVAVFDIMYHTCYTKFLGFLLDSNGNSSFQILEKITKRYQRDTPLL